MASTKMETHILPSLMFEQVVERWNHWHPANPLKRLIAYFRDTAPLNGINILECEDIDVDACEGKGRILTAWKYDSEGVQLIDRSNIREEFEEEEDGKIIDYAYEEACLYSFNQRDKKVKVMWTYLGVTFLSGELKSHRVATEYEIVSEKSGQDSFALIRTAQSEPKAFHAV